MPTMIPPNSELVAIAWLAEVDGLNAARIGTTLPKDAAVWREYGFLQVQSIPSGAPDVDLPVRRPVLQLDGWANNVQTTGNASDGSKAPWGKASALLELVRLGTEEGQEGRYGKPVDLALATPKHENYRTAIVQAVYLVSEPMRVTDDPSGYARFTADLHVDWVLE